MGTAKRKAWSPKQHSLDLLTFLSSSTLMVLENKPFSISESNGQKIVQKKRSSQAEQLSAAEWLTGPPLAWYLAEGP